LALTEKFYLESTDLVRRVDKLTGRGDR